MTLAGACSVAVPGVAGASAGQSGIRAAAFDAFPIFDPRPIFGLAKMLFPEKGEELGRQWFSKIFGYTWLRTTAGQYQDFPTVIAESLRFTARSMGIEMTPAQEDELLGIWLKLKAWPDAADALKRLKEGGIRLAFLSNMSEQMLRTNAANSGIADLFDHYLSTDRVNAYKPAPAAYQLAVDVLRAPKESIAFAAFAGWDAAGADWFGFPTVWVNRTGAPDEELGANTIRKASDLKPLLELCL